MKEAMEIKERVTRASKETGIPVKKVLDFLFALSSGEPIENNILVQKIGVSKNALNRAKEVFSSFLKPVSKNTQLDEEARESVRSLFSPEYRAEEALWSIFEESLYQSSLELLGKYSDLRPFPNRKYDQFTATMETTARRASLLAFFEDLSGKRLLFLGDDDFTSVAVANIQKASEIAVLDIDERILKSIDAISEKEGLKIHAEKYDARKTLPISRVGKFDVVFTDPPYTTEGVKLFVSRAIQALDLSNEGARIYLCYGNSDRAKERFLPIYEAFFASGLMIRWVFDKFNRYHGADSIGSTSSLFVLEVTPRTKTLIVGNYNEPIYTNN